MLIKIGIKGDQAVIKSFKQKRQTFESVIKSAVRTSGLQTEKQAKINCSVKTGNLRRSILSIEERKGKVYTARVGPDIVVAPYALYVEMGHAQQPGRYVPAIGKRLVASWVEGKWYMAKTAVQMRPKIISNLKTAFRKAVK